MESSRSRLRRLTVALCLAALGLLALVGATLLAAPWAGEAPSARVGSTVATTAPPPPAQPARRAMRARAADPLARWSGRGFAVATVRRGRSVVLRAAPGARRLGRVGSRTEFGSPRTFSVQARRGRWLGVAAPERPNGRLAWIDGRSRDLAASRTMWSLRVDLSRRRLDVRRGGRVVKRFRVAIGRPGNPTPPGRFAVTDKIDARAYGGTYGCCILALTGHQPVLPPGWPGGDRLALHGTRVTGSVGTAASTGCLRARDADLRPLMRRLPLGTPVFIRS